jgi:agmatine/peptidylarginine deiminase
VLHPGGIQELAEEEERPAVARQLSWCVVLLAAALASSVRATEPPAALPPATSADDGGLEVDFDSLAEFDHALRHGDGVELPNGAPAALGRLPVRVTPAAGVRLPGEFERQETILLAYNDLVPMYPDLFLDLARALRARTRVSVLVDQGQSEFLDELLSERDQQDLQLDRVQVPHDTMWVRDYGPLVIKDRTGRRTVVDADYLQFGRPLDDAAPSLVASARRLDLVPLNVDLEGGNLLSNGQGLLLSTTVVLEANGAQGREVRDVEEFFRQFFGGEVVFLEPLDGEATGHVDMFATFTSADTVVVGAYDFDTDPVNAALLDRNAARLARLRLRDGRRLRVVRIPMPQCDDGVWRTYTNVVMANGVLAVPVYPEADAKLDRAAVQTYRKLLPGWQVTPIDASEVIASGGALHCMTMNIPAEADGPAVEPSPGKTPRVRRIPLRVTRRRGGILPKPPAG